MRKLQPNSQTPRQVFLSPSEPGGLDTLPGTPSLASTSRMLSERHPPALAAHHSAAGTAPASTAVAYSQHEPVRRDVELGLPAGSESRSGSSGNGGGGGSGRRNEGFERATAAAAAAVEPNRNVGVRTEHLLSRDVQGGRVAAFAGGAAGALLVSQGFGGAGGAVRHGITKVGGRRDSSVYMVLLVQSPAKMRKTMIYGTFFLFVSVCIIRSTENCGPIRGPIRGPPIERTAREKTCSLEKVSRLLSCSALVFCGSGALEAVLRHNLSLELECYVSAQWIFTAKGHMTLMGFFFSVSFLLFFPV